MFAGTWPITSSQPYLFGDQDLAAQRDDDEALDDWLASMTVPQFERIMNLLIDRLGNRTSSLDQPA